MQPHKSTITGNGSDALAFQFFGCREQALKNSWIFAQGPLDRKTLYLLKAHREIVSRGVGDISRNKGIRCIQQKDADGLTITGLSDFGFINHASIS